MRGHLVLGGGAARARERWSPVRGAARRVVVLMGVEGAAITGNEACCVEATGVVARRLEEVSGN